MAMSTCASLCPWRWRTSRSNCTPSAPGWIGWWTGMWRRISWGPRRCRLASLWIYLHPIPLIITHLHKRPRISTGPQSPIPLALRHPNITNALLISARQRIPYRSRSHIMQQYVARGRRRCDNFLTVYPSYRGDCPGVTFQFVEGLLLFLTICFHVPDFYGTVYGTGCDEFGFWGEHYAIYWGWRLLPIVIGHFQ